MILDKGICSIYSVTKTPTGKMPAKTCALKYQSWYGELNFETNPVYETEHQEDVETTERIRITQNRAINSHDILVFTDAINTEPPPGLTQYEIKRAFHGVDEDNGELITDINLRVVKA